MSVKYHLGWWSIPEGMLTVTKDSNYVTDIWNNLTDVNAEKELNRKERSLIYWQYSSTVLGDLGIHYQDTFSKTEKGLLYKANKIKFRG